jgi:hypothetical protein
MPQFKRPLRVGILAAFLAFAPAVFADIISQSPLLPPATGTYSVPDACVLVVCLENISLFGFDVTSNAIIGGNDVTESNVSLSADLFQNLSGTPGAFINSVLLTGQADITYFSRPTLSDSGTFDAQITLLDLSGTFAGLTGDHTITATLNPAQASTGVTSVEPLGTSPQTFQIGSFFDVFAELSIDGGAAVAGPERTAQLTAVPEPALYGALGLVLALMVMRRNARVLA